MLLFTMFSAIGQETDVDVRANLGGSDTYAELSLSEWKRFKNFERKLEMGKSPSLEESKELRSYAKDSLQILEVKLLAIKLLDKKSLLTRDIQENGAYYTSLLRKLRDSDISPSEYLFLEEKMAFFNQKSLENKLAWSQWFNVALVVVFIVLGGFVWVKFKNGNTENTPLSKQENTVRNLILEGKSNKEIASELFISLSTVKTHITHIYNKLDVANRQELFQKSTGTST